MHAAPSPYDGLEAVRDTSDLEVVTAAQHPKHYYPAPGYAESQPPPPPPPPPNPRICGLSRPIFWLAVAITALALGLVGLGVGLGVSLGKAQGANASNGNGSPAVTTSSSPTAVSSSSTTQSTLSTQTSTATSTSTSTSTSTLKATPTSTGIKQTICPGANGTIITPSRGTVKYLVLCDMDFGSGKTDLSELVMDTWDECLTLCNTMNYRQVRTDVGPSWNFAGTAAGGPQTPGTCWCLGGADKSKVVGNRGSVVGVPISS